MGTLPYTPLPLPTCENVVEGCLHVGRVEGARLDEAEVVLLGEGLCLVSGHSPQVPEVGLIPHLVEKTALGKTSSDRD